MLKVSALSKSYGGDVILQGVSFVLSPGQAVGLVGPNGSGKSTLLRLIAGEFQPDSGSVWLDPGRSASYLPQYPIDELNLTVREALIRRSGSVGEIQCRIPEIEHSLASAQGEALDALLAEYADARESYERLGGYRFEARVQEVLAGLGMESTNLDLPVSALSGGNKTKLSLASLLLSDANVLLLDEPTNYLDLGAQLWLERFVHDVDRSYIIVSHDRRFLDRTVTSILELDPESHSIRHWVGNFSAYVEGRTREVAKQVEAYKVQQQQIERIEADIRKTKEQAARTENATNNDVLRRYAKKVAKKAKARERRLERSLESSDRVEKPSNQWGLHLVDFAGDGTQDDRLVFEVQNLSAGYGNREVLRDVSMHVRGQDRIALLGENGSGKSTLIRCLAGQTPYRGIIRVGESIRLGMMSQEGDELPPDKSVLEVFRSRTEMYEDEARAQLHKFLFSGHQVFTPVKNLSYGQRAKLALAVLILSRANALLLDEPTSHMDIPALEAIEQALSEFQGPLLVASHDRYFLENIGINRYEVVSGGTLHRVDGIDAYEDEISHTRAETHA